MFLKYLLGFPLGPTFGNIFYCSLLFLDIKIRSISNSFSASIYRKVTFSKVFTNFESFILVPYKSDLIFTLIFRAFNPNKAGLFEGSFFKN